jgi:hypothetical protein
MDYRIDGQGLLENGLSSSDVVDGVGILTMGLIWSCFSPFVPPSGATIITNWAVSYGTSLTIWSGATGVFYGPC